VVVLRRSPFSSGRDEEGLRVAVGLTMMNPNVAVLLLDAAAWLATDLSPAAIGHGDLAKHWDTLGDVGVERFVERESLAAQGIAADEVRPGVAVRSRAESADLLAEADAVVVY